MSAKLLITRICSCVLMIAISACTSLQTYGLDQINADLPFETGDEITVYLNDENFSERTIIVGEITAEAISGTLVENTDMSIMIPLDEIARVEGRQVSIGKTAALVAISAYLLFAAESLDDALDNISGD